MSQLLYPDFFNNVFGPIMQPGSSDCFAGTARIGNIARALAKGHPKKVRFLFNRRGNGLAYLVNFMSDKGYLGGVQGFLPEDERLFEAHTLARQNDLFYDFNFLETENVYDDSVQIDIETAKGEKVTLTATSIGGGMIITHEINGFKIEWQSDTYGVLIEDDTNSITDTQI